MSSSIVPEVIESVLTLAKTFVVSGPAEKKNIQNL